MKYKIVSENFDEITGVSTVTIQNKYGHFTGVARCCPEDSYSMFQGERIAIMKAQINFCKSRIKAEKNKAKNIDDLLKNFYLNIQTSSAVFKEKTYKTALREIAKCQDNIKRYTDTIDTINRSIKKMDEVRQEVLLRSKENK